MLDSQPSGKAHTVRITSQGKIRNYVSHALEFLQNNRDCPIVLHTLPLPREESESTSTTQSQPKSLPASTTTIPKLLSVVEIIKREYLKSLDATPAPRVHGLHQYNEILSLEEEGRVNSEEQNEVEALKMALEGKNCLKRRQTPCMRITLCRTELPSLELRGAFYQKPLRRSMTKSAQKRARNREVKKAEIEAAPDSVTGLRTPTGRS